MTLLLRWISRCLGVIQISLIISHPEDAKMVLLDLKFHNYLKSSKLLVGVVGFESTT